MAARPPPRLILLLGVVAVATSGPITRAIALPALTLAAWRLAGASPLFWLQARALGQARPRADGRVAGAGARLGQLAAAALLGLHFLTFAAAVKSAGIALATMLLALQPLATALMSRTVTGEPAPPGARRGLALALPGALLVAWPGAGGNLPFPAAGIALALAAALTGSSYFLLVRRLRGEFSFGWLTAANYTGAALLLLVAGAAGAGLAVPAGARGGLLLLILLPTAVGHNLINYALRLLPAPTVNLAILLEPVLATAAALAIFRERPGALFYPGAGLILAGCVAALARRREAEPVEE